jgi:flagellar biosynthesis/type III secretory pathway protein FliH
MSIHFNIETDTLYQKGYQQGFKQGFKQGLEQGLEKGIEQERRKNVINLWQKDIEPAMISNLLNLPIEYIEKVIAEFQKMNDVH